MTLEEKIDQISGEQGFWRSDTREALIADAKLLINQGFAEDDAVNFLQDIYWTISGEYGN